MKQNYDWIKLGKKAVRQGVSVAAELFSDVAVELNKLATNLENNPTCGRCPDPENEEKVSGKTVDVEVNA